MPYLFFKRITVRPAEVTAMIDVLPFPREATLVEVQVDCDTVRCTFDETDPSATVGMRLVCSDEPPKVFIIDAIKIMRATAENTEAGLNFHFWGPRETQEDEDIVSSSSWSSPSSTSSSISTSSSSSSTSSSISTSSASSSSSSSSSISTSSSKSSHSSSSKSSQSASSQSSSSVSSVSSASSTSSSTSSDSSISTSSSSASSESSVSSTSSSSSSSSSSPSSQSSLSTSSSSQSSQSISGSAFLQAEAGPVIQDEDGVNISLE